MLFNVKIKVFCNNFICIALKVATEEFSHFFSDKRFGNKQGNLLT